MSCKSCQENKGDVGTGKKDGWALSYFQGLGVCLCKDSVVFTFNPKEIGHLSDNIKGLTCPSNYIVLNLFLYFRKINN